MKYQFVKQDNGAYRFIHQEKFYFNSGEFIKPLELVYETFGTLSPAKDNVILIHHALSTNSHVCSQPDNLQEGWWEKMVGPGKAIDTNQFFIICINNLGSCFGSSGPASQNPMSGKAYGIDFPPVTIEDMVKSQYLLLEQLGITQLYAIIGNSMGAMLSLTWAILFPHTVRKLISVSSCYRAYPVSVAYHTIQKQIIHLDPAWQKGRYIENPSLGLKIAREVGLISYRDANDLNQRFIDNGEIIEYLEYNASKLAYSFDANCYLYLLEAMDNFDVTKNYANKSGPFYRISANALIISVNSDVLFPPQQQVELYEKLKEVGANCQFKALDSNLGHDAFYIDQTIATEINKFLTNKINI